tara:strand:- start:1029 stop:1442 length:414 start_codon:yes stop_codon:yes gene_type:complete
MIKKILLFSLLLIISAKLAFACSCAMLRPPGYVENADALFVGQVIEIESLEDYWEKITLKINRSYKGISDDLITVYINKNPGACYYLWFTEGKEYIVNANIEGNKMTVGRCSGTESLSKIKDNLLEIEKIIKDQLKE